MNPKDIATEFISAFCRGDVDGLGALLADDAVISGPLVGRVNKQDYMEQLRIDPPAESDFKILSITDNESNVAIFWEYQKKEGAMTIGRLFEIAGPNICRMLRMLVVFDAGTFR